jgi:hypothetical protein
VARNLAITTLANERWWRSSRPASRLRPGDETVECNAGKEHGQHLPANAVAELIPAFDTTGDQAA